MKRAGIGLLAVLGWADPGARPAPRTPAESAIAALHRRAQTAAQGTPEARLISAQLEEIGRACLAQGESGRAIELLGEAYGLDESNGVALAELTLAYVRVEDFEAASFHVRLAEARAQRAPPEIYAVLGDVYEGMHRLSDAVAAWSEAVRQGGQDPRMLRRLARARDELAVASGQRSLSSENFTIFAELAASNPLMESVAERLESIYREQSAFFGARLAKSQVVVLYEGRAYFALASVPDWGSGVYDGKIRVSVPSGAQEADALSAVLAHELAHALMRQVSRDGSPGWLHEGLAQWLEGRRIPLRDLKRAIGARPAESIDALEGGFASALDRAHARTLYAESLSIVEYLVATRGEGTLACVVSRAGDEGSFLEALKSEAGLSPDELYSRWRAWAKV